MKQWLLFFLFIFSVYAQAQILTMSLPPMQNAPGVVWKSIHTDHYEVVFDQELESDAKRVADVLEAVYKPTSESLKKEPTKITVLLFNQSSDANAMVALAPRRSEWYTTPPGSNAVFGNVEWLDLLAVHEIRHVVQYDKAKRGFTKVLYFFLGEFGWAIGSNIALPQWVWEGDAVGSETALSKGGRGRLPLFDLPIRTILLNNELYSYQKAYLGSYKDFYPNHYPLGYLLSTWIKRKYGIDAWEKILSFATEKSYNPYAMSNAIERVTGRDLDEIYKDCMLDLKKEWQEQQKSLTLTSSEKIPVPSRTGWTNYDFPMVDGEGSVYAVKSGLGHIPQLVKISGGEEEVLHIPGFLYDNPFNISKNKIIWNETRFDPRYGQRTYSVLKNYDLKTKKVEQLTSQTRYFSPVYSPDESHIAVIENGLYMKRSLVILDSATFEVKKQFHIPSDVYYFTPSYFPDGKAIAVIKQQKQGQSLVKVDVETGVEEVLYGPVAYTLSRPIAFGEYLYFNSHQSGLDNIWAVELANKKVFQVTSSPYGSYHAYVANNHLYYNDYQFLGMDIVKTPLNPSSWTPLEKVTDGNIKLYQNLVDQENKGETLSEVQSRHHDVQYYNHYKDAFNAHSWVILPNSFANTYDVALITTNKLSTLSSQLGYQYNGNEDTNWGYAQVSYAGLYPIIDAHVAYGGRQSTYTENGLNHAYEWKEEKAGFNFRLPFNFTQDAYLHTLEITSGPEFIKIHDKKVREAFGQYNGTLTSFDSHFRYDHTKRMSMRDIYPEYGQILLANFKAQPFGTDYKGKQTGVNTYLYFPGLFDHHNLWFNLAWEEQRPQNYRYASEFLLPRGYEFFFKERYKKVSTNYTYPVAMIDKNFGMMLNFKRLKQTFFYDHGVGKGAHVLYYNSVGTDLTFDMNILTFKIPFDLGARFTYLINKQKWDITPLFFSVAIKF
ncbi:MAG: hypothetical protein ACOYL6_14820 [Bacteriovoracaceae bacterium]